jgi:2-oxoglutarate ferredoxin oxidoreductase subunit beta
LKWTTLNTYQWFKAKTYDLDSSYDPHDRFEALKKASEVDKLPLSIFYVNPRPTFEEKLNVYQEGKDPLYKRSPALKKLSEWIDSKRGI